MDPRTNPCTPSAGTPPPEFAGRGDLLEEASVALDRIRNGLAAKNLLIIGQRGIGKTALLNRIARDAEGRGFKIVALKVQADDRQLPELLAASLKVVLLEMNGSTTVRAIKALIGFIRAREMKVQHRDLEAKIGSGGEPGLANSGHLQGDLIDLLCAAGEAARAQHTALALFIDELQYVEEHQYGALVAALHRTAQLQLPVTLVGAGLPQLVTRTGAAKSYAERLFTFREIGPLEDKAAMIALEAPQSGVLASSASSSGRALKRSATRP